MNKLMSLALLLALVLGCRTISTLTGNDTNLKKVGDLWSDVPRMDGLVSSEAEMPMFIKILMRTALNNLYRLNSNGEDKTPATGDWAVFSTTKTTEDVKNFYTNERMTTFGNWEASKNSTCLDGKEQGFSGAMCVFGKNLNNKFIGLMIVATPDEKKKETILFFVRVEREEKTPNKPANTNSTPRAEIKPLNGSAPYAVEKRPLPEGADLDALLPKQVGPYARTLLEKSDQRGVTPSSIDVDGNSVYATYTAGAKEIFVEFAVAGSAHNAQATLDNAASETDGTFPADPRVGSIGTEPSYFRSNSDTGAFYAWTRGNYYFSASAKGGETDLNAFMQSFPY
jgi:hypothetical protein